MTAEQLEELLGKVTQGEWRVAYERGVTKIYAGRESIMGDESYYPWVPENLNDWGLIALAPSLARRVIAAEILVEALDNYIAVISEPNHTATSQMMSRHQLDNARTAYREASKGATQQ